MCCLVLTVCLLLSQLIQDRVLSSTNNVSRWQVPGPGGDWRDAVVLHQQHQQQPKWPIETNRSRTESSVWQTQRDKTVSDKDSKKLVTIYFLYKTTTTRPHTNCTVIFFFQPKIILFCFNNLQTLINIVMAELLSNLRCGRGWGEFRPETAGHGGGEEATAEGTGGLGGRFETEDGQKPNGRLRAAVSF